LEALLPAFIAAALAEWGDKTQLLVIALAARYGRPGPILAGVALGALAGSLVAGFGGTLVHGTATLRALSLLVGVALVFAGASAFIGRKTPLYAERLPGPPALAAALGIFVAEFGDRTQFVTFSLAAYHNSVLPALGAAAGVAAASIPAAFLARRMAGVVPVRALRFTGGCLFLLTGIVVALRALRLV
jgi:putative Ca2+/H+ antiporter (TMEM165/GDT1 family)